MLSILDHSHTSTSMYILFFTHFLRLLYVCMCVSVCECVCVYFSVNLQREKDIKRESAHRSVGLHPNPAQSALLFLPTWAGGERGVGFVCVCVCVCVHA